MLILALPGYAISRFDKSKKEIVTLENSYRLKLPNELEKYRDKLEKSVKPFVKITTKKGRTLPWESKFGGTPYLPIGYEYPIDIQGTAMRLLAQINFEELPAMDQFPKKGILQFYISASDDFYGLNFDKPTCQENFKVIYISEVVKDDSKIITDFSFINNSEDDYFPIASEGRLQFSIEYAPVACSDFQFEKIFNDVAYSIFNDEECDWYEKEYSGAGHKVGGYAYFTQYDPRGNNGYNDYDILLLQIDTDDELGIMWGDCGVANFFIRAEDLERLDFTRVLYNWDCC